MPTLPLHPALVHVPLGLALLSLLLVPSPGRAHCDTLDGPVVKTGRAALDANDVAPALAWVKPEHEKEITAAFQAAIAARKGDATRREATDHRFLETLVRVHRAGEGAPFSGLKPVGDGVGAAVQAADRAIVARDVAPVERVLAEAVRSGLHERFAAVVSRPPPGKDVAAGRAWVDAYVKYVHYVERLEQLARGGGDAHGGAGHDDGDYGDAAHGSAGLDGAGHGGAGRGGPGAQIGTIGNLDAAHRADIQARARYLAFAERADEESFANAAALFRAAAHAEGVRARSHRDALRRLGAEPSPVTATPPAVRGTRANLLAILAQENAERVAVYPRLVEQARQAAMPDAVLTFTLAGRAEDGLVRLYQEAVSGLAPARRATEVFHVCETCGHVVRGAPPDRCPVSLSPRAAFTVVR